MASESRPALNKCYSMNSVLSCKEEGELPPFRRHHRTISCGNGGIPSDFDRRSPSSCSLDSATPEPSVSSPSERDAFPEVQRSKAFDSFDFYPSFVSFSGKRIPLHFYLSETSSYPAPSLLSSCVQDTGSLCASEVYYSDTEDEVHETSEM